MARLEVAGKVLAMFYLAWNLEPPTGMERTAKVGIWAKALKNIPVAHILGLAEEEIREPQSSFFPKPADLIKRYNQKHGLTPEGASNVAAYLPYQPSTRHALSAPPVPLQIEPEELKKRLGYAASTVTPEEVEEPKAGGRWSGSLVDVARAGNIDLDACTPQQIADLRAFGRWWISMHPTLDLPANNFGDAYRAFCETRPGEDER